MILIDSKLQGGPISNSIWGRHKDRICHAEIRTDLLINKEVKLPTQHVRLSLLLVMTDSLSTPSL